jgi:transcriptional regulator with XRE-family HTH domain
MDPAYWLRELRARHSVSQADLAIRAGTTQQALSRIENGAVSPSVNTLGRLAATVGEDLTFDSRPREVPFDPDQLAAALARPMAERLELSLSWNRFAVEVAAAGAKARERN